MTHEEALKVLRAYLSDLSPLGPTNKENLRRAIAALESEPEPLAEDAGPLWFDHLGFPHLRGQHITVPLLGEWVAGLDGGTQLGVTITRKPDA